jgi:pyoverdine/dityrosine biosynthesis protein Dit1
MLQKKNDRKISQSNDNPEIQKPTYPSKSMQHEKGCDSTPDIKQELCLSSEF